MLYVGIDNSLLKNIYIRKKKVLKMTCI